MGAEQFKFGDKIKMMPGDYLSKKQPLHKKDFSKGIFIKKAYRDHSTILFDQTFQFLNIPNKEFERADF
jgi:hypothetical protein